MRTNEARCHLRALRVRAIAALGVLLVAFATPAFAADVQVRVRRGDLQISGGAGDFFDVAITPTATGLRVEVDGTTLNGSREAFETDRVTRDWRLDFRHAGGVGLNVTAPAAGVPALSPRRVRFVGPRELGHIGLEGVEVRKTVRVDFGLTAQSGSFAMEGCTVGRGVRVVGRAQDTGIWWIDSSVGAPANVRFRPRRAATGGSLQYRIQGCELASLRMTVERTLSENKQVALVDTVVHGNAGVFSTFDVLATRLDVGRNLVLKSNVGEQDHELDQVTVGNKTTIVTGKAADTVSATDCSLGLLRLRTGVLNDALITRRVTAEPGSSFDGADGPGDLWLDDAGHAWLRTIGVEELFDQQPDE